MVHEGGKETALEDEEDELLVAVEADVLPVKVFDIDSVTVPNAILAAIEPNPHTRANGEAGTAISRNCRVRRIGEGEGVDEEDGDSAEDVEVYELLVVDTGIGGMVVAEEVEGIFVVVSLLLGIGAFDIGVEDAIVESILGEVDIDVVTGGILLVVFSNAVVDDERGTDVDGFNSELMILISSILLYSASMTCVDGDVVIVLFDE